MLDRSLDTHTDEIEPVTHTGQAGSYRNHTLAPSAIASSDGERSTAESAFPVRVDLPHANEPTAVPERQQFFQRKYSLDRCMGGVLLVLFSPLILALYVLVRLTSRGPGFYKQERVGLNGRNFEIYKLRSMVQNAEKPGQPQWAVKGDSRVNLVGRVLRKLHLDELPQLFNVCRGEMSLVGPRPERPQICADLAREIKGYCDRTAVKPGVTGLAQINLPPDETVDDVRRKQILDLHYIENAGLWLDLRMIIATALRMFGVQGSRVTRLMCLDRTHLTKHIGSTGDPGDAMSMRRVPGGGRSEAAMDTRSIFQSAAAMSVVNPGEDNSYISCLNRPR